LKTILADGCAPPNPIRELCAWRKEERAPADAEARLQNPDFDTTTKIAARFS
jgi:hypothetical protein